MTTLWNDIRYGLRMLARSPGFTAIAVLTLAIGIGANTAMFSFVSAVLLRPLPYAEPDRLVMVFENQPTQGWFKMAIGAPVLEAWRRQSTVFESLGAARSYGNFTLTGTGRPETLKGSSLSANVFPLLGLKPMLGRGFMPEEETFGNHRVVVLSYELWQRRFGGDAALMGQSLTLGGEPYTVVGVMPPRTISPDGDRELWTPLAFKPYELAERHTHNFSVYGRLKPGVTLAQAREEMDRIARRMAEADPQNRGWGAEVHPLRDIIVGHSRPLLLVLLGSVGAVLLIGCANIAGLLLARSAARTHELAIRVALGAGRAALIRQLLTESLLLAAIGGAAGLFLAWLGINALVRFSPPDLPRMAEGVRLDGITLAFVAVIIGVTGTAFGLIPAWQASNSAMALELAEGGRGGSAGPRRQFARATLVVAEVSLSMVLLICAGLTIRSFARLLGQNLGFVPDHLVTMLIGLPEREYPGQVERMRVFDPLLAAVRAIPGVESAACAYGAPLTYINTRVPVTVRGAQPPAPGEAVSAGYAQVSPGYFATMKIPLLQGRDFSDLDDRGRQPVVIVDETFVRNFGLGVNVLGRRIDVGDGAENAEIVGVVRDIKHTDVADATRGEMYRPCRQICWGVATLMVRTPRDPADVIRAIRTELDGVDKDLPLENVRTMSQLVATHVSQRRLSVELLGGFAGAAVLLAALGLYGVLACTVTQRRREIGIRMALGADPRDVLGLVLWQGMKMAVAGIGIGLVSALAITRVLAGLLFGVSSTDPATFMAVALLLSGVTLLACWIPAQRAVSIDPMQALRCE
jgi:putative ABC transport system permease protein